MQRISTLLDEKLQILVSWRDTDYGVCQAEIWIEVVISTLKFWVTKQKSAIAMMPIEARVQRLQPCSDYTT